MDIESKISLSRRPGKISLIREGIFLRCYQESLLSLLRVTPSLKVLGRRVKKLSNTPVFYGGFPESHIDKFVTGAIRTDWGFEVACEEILAEEYDIWIASVTDKLAPDKLNDEEKVTSKGSRVTNKTGNERVYMSEDVVNFLMNWHPGLYPQSVDTGFIQGLKQRLCGEGKNK